MAADGGGAVPGAERRAEQIILRLSRQVVADPPLALDHAAGLQPGPGRGGVAVRDDRRVVQGPVLAYLQAPVVLLDRFVLVIGAGWRRGERFPSFLGEGAGDGIVR